MKLQVMDVAIRTSDLIVTFNRDDWAQTEAGIRAMRVLCRYAPLSNLCKGRKLLLGLAADQSAINSTETCRKEIAKWSSHKLKLTFSDEVRSAVVNRPLNDADEARYAQRFGYMVTAYVTVGSTLALLERDRRKIEALNYGRLKILTSPINSTNAGDLVVSVQMIKGVNPWTIMGRLRRDIERLIK